MASQFPGDRPSLDKAHTPPPHPPAPGGQGLVERVKNILVSPKTEWPRIDAEPASERQLFLSYAVPLAAIPAACNLVGQLAFPTRVFGVVIRVSPVTAIVGAVFGYAMSLLAIWLMARIVDALAPTFGGQRSVLNATKLVIFSAVPSWLAGVGGLIPGLGVLFALAGAAYAIYLLYLGMPVLMKSPPDKTVGYIVVTAVVGFVVFFVLGMVAAALGSLFAPASVGTVTFS